MNIGGFRENATNKIFNKRYCQINDNSHIGISIFTFEYVKHNLSTHDLYILIYFYYLKIIFVLFYFFQFLYLNNLVDIPTWINLIR